MKLLESEKNVRALTSMDVLLSVAVVVIIALLLLGASGRQPRSPRINCLTNLKQIGLGFRIWSNDHAEHFPWTVPQSNGGTLEFAMSTQVWRHFEIASNEWNSPKIFACPSDSGRIKARSWEPQISNQNLSYFVGLDADETKPQTILSGDRNLTTNGLILSGVISIHNANAVGWTTGFHPDGGNIGLGDGSVMQVSGKAVFQCVSNAGLPLRLSIP